MSKRQKNESSEASDHQEKSSVYDFLYHDARRVGSFLAQFDPNGLLQSLKQTEAVVRSSSSADNISAQAGVPIVANLSGNAYEQAGKQNTISSDRTYDPLWANAIALLTYLNQHDLIKKSLFEARIGQLVLLTGTIKISDLGLLKTIWKTPALKQLITGPDGSSDTISEANKHLTTEIIGALPHTVQAQVFSEEPDAATWMILEEDHLVVSSGSLLMKYGSYIGGKWRILGIKDADCDGGPVIDTDLQAEINVNLEAAAQARYTTPLALLVDSLSPFARLLMGRHGAWFGVTPILIFREVSPD